jgi:hypothetical protein
VNAASLPSRRGVRAAFAAVAVAGGAVLLAACGSGFGAQAEQKYQPADGVDVTAGTIHVLNAVVVAPEDGGDGVVSMTVVNKGTTPDQLQSVTSPQGQVETATPADLAPNQAVAFSSDSTPVWTIRGLTSKPGSYVDLVLTFARAGMVNVETVVVPAAGYYASITAAPVPSDTSSGGTSVLTVTPTGSTSASPSTS